jgi:hypothetical protein
MLILLLVNLLTTQHINIIHCSLACCSSLYAPVATTHVVYCITARPCDQDGNFLPHNSPPPPKNNDLDWSPFKNRSSFKLAKLVFEQAEMSAGKIDQLLRIWAA